MWSIFFGVVFYRSLKLQGTKFWLVTWTFLHRKYHCHQRTHPWFLISPGNYDIMNLVFIWNIFIMEAIATASQLQDIFSFTGVALLMLVGIPCVIGKKESVGCAIQFLKWQTKNSCLLTTATLLEEILTLRSFPLLFLVVFTFPP